MQAMPRIGFIAIAGVLSSAAMAAGYYLPGSVSVFESGTRQYMQATMNVRYNTSIAGSPYVLVNGYANSSITIAGRDSENEYFSCYVLPTSPLYAAASAMQSGAGDGSRIYVYKQTSSGECENFSLGHYSYFQS
ncbi:MAG: hypothetical protein ACOY3E_03900 [Pseudomonadota bacterium]